MKRVPREYARVRVDHAAYPGRSGGRSIATTYVQLTVTETYIVIINNIVSYLHDRNYDHADKTVYSAKGEQPQNDGTCSLPTGNP